MTTEVTLLALGPVRVIVDGRQHIPRPAQADLLASLMVHRGGPITAEELSIMVWGEYRRSALHPAISRLRGWLTTATGDAATITHGEAGYRLHTAGRIDTLEFDQWASRAREGEAAQRFEAWTHALRLFRGIPADGTRRTVRDHPSTREWSLLRSTAVTEATQLALRLDRAAELVDPVAKASAQHPDNEHIQASWALLLAETGQRPEALEHLDRYRSRLADRFGTDPVSQYFHAAQRRILRRAVPARTAPSTEPKPWFGAREGAGSCLGRHTDLDELDALLDDRRIVTLVGPGGIGKSTLAYRLARRRNRRQSVVAVALQSATSGADVVAQLAEAFPVPDGTGSRLDRLAAGLGDGPRLLLLDNCDRIGEAVVSVAARLQVTNPRLTVLATSRTPLGANGEQVWRVDPLRLPRPDNPDDATSPAVELFHEVARQFDHRFQPNRAEREAIGRLCRLVDGMPLAIRILASRVHIFSAAELAAGLATAGGALDLPHPTDDPRHRSMSATLDWGFDLVPEPARRLLGAVSVLSAPFGADLAAAVAGIPVHSAAAELTRLADHSLLRPIRTHGRTRFMMLEPVRQHARRRGEGPDGTAGLIEYWLRFVRELDALPRYADRIGFADQRRDDAAHLVRAVQLSEPDVAAELLARGYEYWMCGYDLPGRGQSLLAEQVAADVADPELNCLLRYWSGLQAALGYDYPAARRIIDAVVDDLAVHRPREHRQAILLQATCANSRLDPDALDLVRAAVDALGNLTSDGTCFVAACCGMATAITWGRFDLAESFAQRHDLLAAECGHRPSNTYLALRSELAVATGANGDAARYCAELLRRLTLPGSVGDAEPVYCAVVRTHLAFNRPWAAIRTARRGIRNLEDRWSQAASRTVALRVLYAEALRRVDEPEAARHQLRMAIDTAHGFARFTFAAAFLVAAVNRDPALASDCERVRTRLGLPVPPSLVSAIAALDRGQSDSDVSVADVIDRARGQLIPGEATVAPVR